MAESHSRTGRLARTARRVGATAAIPLNYFERGIIFALTAPVKPLWRRLDALSPRFEKSRAARIIAVALFPTFIIAAIVLGFAAVRGGLTIGTFAFAALFIASMGLIIAPLERLMPWSRNWLDRQDSGTDLLMLLSVFGSMSVTGPLHVFLTAWLVQWIHAELPPDTIRSFWPTGIHPVLQVFLLLVVKDFFRYWYHRWMHENPFMWRWHSVHHSSARLYWFNGVRGHPLEEFLSNLLWVVPFTLIQAPADIVYVAGLCSLVIGRFQHTNLAAKLGPLEHVFSGPDNHRYHHAKTAEEGNTNYGGDIMLWDHLFGTFYLPKGKRPSEDIGVGGIPDYPQTWVGLMLAPFRIQMWREKARADAAKKAQAALAARSLQAAPLAGDSHETAAQAAT